MKFPIIVILIFTLMLKSALEVSGQETAQKPEKHKFLP